MDDGSSFAHLRDANTANATKLKILSSIISGLNAPAFVPFSFGNVTLHPVDAPNRFDTLKLVAASLLFLRF